jgi:hypothetical protein
VAVMVSHLTHMQEWAEDKPLAFPS